MKHDSYCNAAFAHSYADNNKFTPCCWWQIQNHKPATGVKQMFNSSYMQQVREGMLNDEPLPVNCQTCKEHEDAGGKSHRMLHNEKFGFQAEAEIKSLEINLGNLCNLACVMCGSYNSSKWYEDEQKLYGLAKGELFSSFGKRIVSNISGVEKSFKLNQLSWDILKNLEGLKLAGGEILMMPQHIELVKKLIDYDIAKNIDIVYIVNVMHNPNQFKKYWKKFKRVHIIVSLDGTGPVAEYVRYHSKWKIIEQNLRRYFTLCKENDNYILSSNTTVSLLNVAHLVDVYNYWNFLYIQHLQRLPHAEEQGMYRVITGPDNLHIKHIPDYLRKPIIDELDTVQHLQHIAQRLRANNDTKKWKNSLNWIEKLDKIRGNNFYDINPQFKS
jgi:hypothetical protein